ncbi:MAG: cytochrome c biogenesis protein CcdA, partial [Chloroflexi bacterium]|nr:cytochrome c biogenesis protein CcdA [Chloroflexota bacterium]
MDPANLSLLVAFGAGVLSFLSPCVLPLVPAYVGYLAGPSMLASTQGRRLATLLHSAAFVLGFSAVFVGFWASIGLIGYVLPGFSGLFRQVGGAILVILGLHQIGLFKAALLYRQWRRDVVLTSGTTPVASFFVGVAFAAGWTPCVGPVLAGIIGLASMSDTVSRGTFLLVAYSLGLGVPFLATGLALA